MLTERFGADLARLLIPADRFRPFPPADDRTAWKALPADLRARQVAAGLRHIGRQWPPLPATLFMEFARTGNRTRFEHAHFERRNALVALVVAECVEGCGRFADDIANGIWTICEESFWGVPAHNDGDPLPDPTRPIFDLFAGETAGLLACVDFLLGSRLDPLSPRLRARIRHEVDRRILRPFLERDDFWWMGLRGDRHLNNWTPWCTSNALAATLLLESDHERRTALVARALGCLDRYLEPYPRDGGCDEGTSYWGRAGGSLLDCLEWLWAASGGTMDAYDEPLVREMGRYLLRMHIGGDWFVNFADGAARVHIAADVVYRYGLRIGDAGLAALGAAAHRRHPEPDGSLPRLVPALFHVREIAAAPHDPPLLRDAWLPDLGVMAARARPGSIDGLYLAAKAGHNGESHNHNDVGQFIVSADGKPVLIDVGVGTYTRETFSDRRYEIWTMRSAYHNLPTVRGVEQAAGSQYRARAIAYRADDAAAELSMDIAGAYPAAAAIAWWRRTVRLVRGGAGMVEVIDDFRLAGEPGEVTLSLLTCREPALRDSLLTLTGAPEVQVAFSGDGLEATVEVIPVDDARLGSVWGERLWRVLLRSRGPVQAGRWRLAVTR